MRERERERVGDNSENVERGDQRETVRKKWRDGGKSEV